MTLLLVSEALGAVESARLEKAAADGNAWEAAMRESADVMEKAMGG